MTVKFEIEVIFRTGKEKNKECFVFAKCLEMQKIFSLTDQSKLGDIAISNFLSQPRATDKEGKPRLDLFAFKIRYKRDWEKMKENDVIELNHIQIEN
ncbi:MAG: hypothetical protein AAGJ18_16650 [Bacteroidota bacterium]